MVAAVLALKQADTSEVFLLPVLVSTNIGIRSEPVGDGSGKYLFVLKASILETSDCYMGKLPDVTPAPNRWSR